MRQTNQRGIAIGPILAVVAILAVLASAIAAGSGSFNSDTSAVKAKAQATAILEQAHEVKLGVDRVIAKGCTNTEISFENPMVSGYTNSNAPSDKSCHVFDVNGGGIVWKSSPPNIGGRYNNEGYFYTGHYNITGTAGGHSHQDLIMFLINIPADVCGEINKILFSSSSIAPFPWGYTSFLEIRKFGLYWLGFGGSSKYPFLQCLLSPSVTYESSTEINQYHFYNVLISN
ncbi:MAG: hypothetical protein IPI58_02925 [Alphaproteobacteria bacterium]|nr:MAG: hypothetical protein IPI58_02925 [Alphaproteobacteria bacterium]